MNRCTSNNCGSGRKACPTPEACRVPEKCEEILMKAVDMVLLSLCMCLLVLVGVLIAKAVL